MSEKEMSSENLDSQPQRKVVVKAAWWSALQSWGARLVSLAVFVVLARLLGPEEFGLAALALVVITLIQVLMEHGIGESIIQRPKITREELNTSFWITFFLGCGLTMAVYFSSGYFSAVMNEPRLEDILKALSPACLIASIASVPTALMRREFNFKLLAIRTMIATFCSGIVAVICAINGMGVWSLVLQNLVFSTLSLILIWFGCSWRPGLDICLKAVSSIGRFSLHSLGAVVSNFLSLKLIELLIGLYFGVVSLGYFSIAYKIVSIVHEMFNQITSQISMSTFSRLQDNHERLRTVFYEAISLTTIMAFPAFVGMSLLADSIVPLVFGEKWMPVVPILQVLSMLGVVYSAGNLMFYVMVAQGRPDLRLMMYVMRVLFSLGAFYILMDYGLTAISFGYILAILMILPLSLYISNKLIKVNVLIYLSRCYPAISGSIVMAVIAFMLDSLTGIYKVSLLTEFFIKGWVLVIAYMVTIFYIDRNTIRRVKGIVQIIRGRN